MPTRSFPNPYAELTQPDAALGGLANLANGLFDMPMRQQEAQMQAARYGREDMFRQAQLQAGRDRLNAEQGHWADDLDVERQRNADMAKHWDDANENAKARNSERSMVDLSHGAKAFLGMLAPMFGGGKPAKPADVPMRSGKAWGEAVNTARTHLGHDADPAAVEDEAGRLYDSWQTQPNSNLAARPPRAPGVVTMPGGVQPPPDVSAGWLRRSGQTGVHSFGDLLGGISDLWTGQPGEMPVGGGDGPDREPDGDPDDRAPRAPSSASAPQVMPKAILLQKAAKAGITPQAAAQHYQSLGIQIGD